MKYTKINEAVYKDENEKHERQRKGAFYTPKIWVEKSQEYLSDTLGKNWQDEYYIWDCAAGTGNLINGLKNKDNIWASTLDYQDIELLKSKSFEKKNLLIDHIFQFDFLNDDFDKLPKELYEIISDTEKRKKLIIYINPPYVEAGSYGTKSKLGVSRHTIVYNNYGKIIGKAINELFIQFLIRIKFELNNCIIAEFSTLKHIQGSNFRKFREFFTVEFLKGFIVPANTFDGVKGSFPIGFFIFDTDSDKRIENLELSVYNSKGSFLQNKKIYYCKDEELKINNWLKLFYDKNGTSIGIMHNNKTDFQTSKQVCITSSDNKDHTTPITPKNLIQMSIYLAVRHCIEANWLNNRDQFLYPNDGWIKDNEFQSNCLTFTLFHNQNRISSKVGINHWIPFTEYEVSASGKFKSSFMTDFIKGQNFNIVDDTSKITLSSPISFDSNSNITPKIKPLEFSCESIEVFDAARQLWKYYHSIPDAIVDASLFDIREYFQGRNENGRMKSKSKDEIYNHLIFVLREKLKKLSKKIEVKVYEYGFLKFKA